MCTYKSTRLVASMEAKQLFSSAGRMHWDCSAAELHGVTQFADALCIKQKTITVLCCFPFQLCMTVKDTTRTDLDQTSQLNRTWLPARLLVVGVSCGCPITFPCPFTRLTVTNASWIPCNSDKHRDMLKRARKEVEALILSNDQAKLHIC